MHLTRLMNQRNLPIPEALTDESLRGFLFLGFFGALIAAKCAASEAFRIYYGIEINSALFIWLPSLVLGGAVCLLYIAGPGSGFHPYWRTWRFLVPAALIWLTIAFSVVRQVPSVLVPGTLSIFLAVLCFVLGTLYNSLVVKFLTALWLFAALVCFFTPGFLSYTIFAVSLVIFGATPTGIVFLQLRKQISL